MKIDIFLQMKINLIVNQEDFNSNLDANILNFLFKKIKDKTEINLVDIKNYKCGNASLNIFLGCINLTLTKHAKMNIIIPNNSTFRQQNINLLENFDYILCKTKYIKTLLEPFISNDKLKYIGWRSTDLNNNYEKDWDNFMLYCFDKNFTQYNTILENWKEDYPLLNVVNYQPIIKKDNIIYHENIENVEFENLFNKCGFHLCLQEYDTFPHNINQCCLSKSIPVLINGSPMNQTVNKDNVFMISGKKKKNKNFIGSKTTLNIDNLHKEITKIQNLNDDSFESMGINNKMQALKNHSENDTLFKEVMKHIFREIRSKSKTKEKEEMLEEYPTVSIVTLPHNRKNFFDLSIYNYNTINYTKSKLQWIIYDTSIEEEKVEDLLPSKEEREKDNILYVHDTNTYSVGEKRNKAIELATNEIIIFMDDDDYYYANSLKKRVEQLVLNKKKIVGCTILGCFNINKGISFIESGSFSDNYENRVSIASLGFYKEVWEETKFDDSSIHEANTLITNNLKDFKEISWEEIIVSMVHRYNLTNRTTPNIKPNGNHYNFSNGMYNYLI